MQGAGARAGGRGAMAMGGAQRRWRSGLAGRGYPPGWRNPHPPRLVDLTLRIYQWREALFQTRRTSARLGSYHPPIARVGFRAPAFVNNCPFLCGDCDCPLLRPLCPAAFSLLLPPPPSFRTSLRTLTHHFSIAISGSCTELLLLL